MGWWWDFLTGNRSSVTHILLVMGWGVMRLPGWKRVASLTCCCWWDMSDEAAWQRKMVVWLTSCEDEVRQDHLAETKGNLTHNLLVIGWDKMGLPAWQKDKGSVTHILLVMEGHDEVLEYKISMSLTRWSSWDKMRQDSQGRNKDSVTDPLLVMKWSTIKLLVMLHY